MIFYAVLVPWHTVSQATAALVQSDDARNEPPCHQAAANADDPSKQSAPSGPPTKCPICCGFGALHVAASVPANLVVLGSSESEVSPTTVVEGMAYSTWRAPQSRGPPSLSI
jgi:hypothetical protein